MKAKKVAIVYDRVNKWGGAERVLLALLELFPNATLFTSVYDSKSAPWANSFKKINTSFLQRVPFAKNNHEYFALLMPTAFESLNFKEYDLVISVTSEAAKGVFVPASVPHICYCLTPTRYLWSSKNEYLSSRLLKIISAPAISYLRSWDLAASTRPDHMIGISTAVQKRIKKYYQRDSALIFPPVDLEKFSTKSKTKGEYYLLVSRLVKYKKVDIAVRAFKSLNKKLVVVGSGREEMRLKRIARGSKNIKFVGFVTDSELKKLYSGAKALIFPQKEDFGLVAVEAQSAGVPVIAYKGGGALDTVISQQSGIFFNKQTPESLIDAVKIFEKMTFNTNFITENAKQFAKERFLGKFATMIKQV